jgi:hypothetical protein
MDVIFKMYAMKQDESIAGLSSNPPLQWIVTEQQLGEIHFPGK